MRAGGNRSVGVVSRRTRVAAALNFDGFGDGRGARYAGVSTRRRAPERRFRLWRRSRPDRRSVADPIHAARLFAPSRRSRWRRSAATRRSAPARRSAGGA